MFKDTVLYIGGKFKKVNGMDACGVANWDGHNWDNMSGGLRGEYYQEASAFAVWGDSVFVGGSFDSVGMVISKNLAIWDGSDWKKVGTAGRVYSLCNFGNSILVSSISHIAALNRGFTWSNLDKGIDGVANAMAVQGDSVFVGGWFSKAGGDNSSNFAVWNGQSWANVGQFSSGKGLNADAHTITYAHDKLYVGGSFSLAGITSVDAIVELNNGTWNALESESYIGSVFTISPSENGIYAGGDFTNIGQEVSHWNGSSWEALGSGANGPVFASVSKGDTLYIGGRFTQAGGINVNYAAMWDGAQWHTLGSGFNSYVETLTFYKDDLIAGGYFTEADGNSASHIAKWDGESWSEFGGGVEDNVFELAADTENLYAGGNFVKAGPIWASYIAKWDGQNWNAMGDGIIGVRGISFFEDYVIAASQYAIHAWDGETWHQAGGIANDFIDDVEVVGREIYVAGRFTQIGSVVSGYFGHYTVNNSPKEVPLVQPPDGTTLTSIDSPLEFVWNSSTALDEDMIHYTFHISELGKKDSTISGISDTVLVFDGSSFFTGSNYYNWYVTAYDDYGSSTTTEVFTIHVSNVLSIEDDGLSTSYELFQNYPNPFNPNTSIEFSLPKAVRVELSIYNVLGQQVAKLIEKKMPMGTHRINLNGSELASGIYIYVIETDEFHDLKKMILLK